MSIRRITTAFGFPAASAVLGVSVSTSAQAAEGQLNLNGQTNKRRTRRRLLGTVLAGVTAATMLVGLAVAPAHAAGRWINVNDQLEWDGENLLLRGFAACNAGGPVTFTGTASQTTPQAVAGTPGTQITGPLPCDGEGHRWALHIKPKSGVFTEGEGLATVRMFDSRGVLIDEVHNKAVHIDDLTQNDCGDIC
ncbi:hypothetical protein ACFCY8_13305 [Streptomyces noursei]|uniref:hypothetical protein n=1 Tax=Streptomyces noursei TaxID=1971 RepID=UPI0035DE049F